MTGVVRTYEREGLSIEVIRGPTSTAVAWRGISDSRTPANFLSPIIQELTELLKGQKVTVDFTSLEYINSATVAPLIRLVRALDVVCEDVHVLFSGIDWQKTHFRCMSAIGRTLKHVRVEIAAVEGTARSVLQ
jgi:hypothetical protein